MFTSLLYEARIWPVVWRRRLAYYWRFGEKDNLAFLGMLAGPVVVLASIVYFAFTRASPIDLPRIEAAHRDAVYKRAVDLQCLAENIYFEARGEPLAGQYAVAEVTMNRTRSRYFPHTICEVVHEARWDPIRKRLVAHFSWTELRIRTAPAGPAWMQATSVARAVYDDTYTPVVPGALFYHATRIHPDWANTQKAVATIGKHIFYR
ncbi:MAG: cell wall hydrolase [Gammaproteobacteria bacterium]